MENILRYYLMPHPPLIIPSIGEGGEFEIQRTIDACNCVGKEIQELKPETIVIVSPHGTKFSDAISISNGEKIRGNLKEFKDSQITIEKHIDRQFNQKLEEICKYDNIPVVLYDSNLLKKFHREYKLDYASIIPMYFIEKFYKNYKIVQITYNNLSDVQLYKFGMAIKQTAKSLDRSVVFIDSMNLSKILTDEEKYQDSNDEINLDTDIDTDIDTDDKINFDTELISNLENGDVKSIFNIDKSKINDAVENELKSILIMLGAMDLEKINTQVMSYETDYKSSYSVIKFDNTKKDKSKLESIISMKEEILNKANKISSCQNPYVKLSRDSLNHYFTTNHLMAVPHNIPCELKQNQSGVFVSLIKEGELRGCVGTTLPETDSIAQEIIRNTIQAATRDYRFSKITLEELNNIEISIDIISRPSQATKEELNPKKYGILVTQGSKKGVVLPNSPGINTVNAQIKLACKRANININENYELEKFETNRYKENLQ